jgi:hypothetical protein
MNQDPQELLAQRRYDYDIRMRHQESQAETHQPRPRSSGFWWLILGVLIGALVMWFFKDRIAAFIFEQWPSLKKPVSEAKNEDYEDKLPINQDKNTKTPPEAPEPKRPVARGAKK